jgi:hypothetical protein
MRYWSKRGSSHHLPKPLTEVSGAQPETEEARLGSGREQGWLAPNSRDPCGGGRSLLEGFRIWMAAGHTVHSRAMCQLISFRLL